MDEYTHWLSMLSDEGKEWLCCMQAAYMEKTQLPPDKVMLVVRPRLFGPGHEFFFAPKVGKLEPATLI